MCIGIPSKVIQLNDQMALVDALGEERWVSLILMAEEVSLGDYLLIQVGNFAVEIIEPERAKSSLLYLQQIAQEELS
jgi:hydrogenase expression/formation protein HypC